MEVEKLNCWEFKECGREPGGKHVALYGVCVAATETRADGIHDGRNGGRCCWVIAASSCTFRRTNDSLFTNCNECDFYSLVKESSELLITV
ncbi:MAG: hypothetical protein D3910_24915 [Candidatus Electrothrix sp. ATG2]|nr:hypothetical protein [Candidatus Electrothrix sp. ATG2]